MSKELTVFYLEGCPYCKNAKRAVEAIGREDKALGDVPIRWIEESREPKLAEQFDYYHVPSVFLDGEKLYECSPADDYAVIEDRMRKALRQARG